MLVEMFEVNPSALIIVTRVVLENINWSCMCHSVIVCIQVGESIHDIVCRRYA